jgi:hypothetical protein
MQLHGLKSLLSRVILSAVALSGLAFAAAPAAQADERQVVRYDNWRERAAIAHHGFYSPQAEYWRHERREAFSHGWRDRYGRWHR